MFGIDTLRAAAGAAAAFIAGTLLCAGFGRLVIPALVKRKLNDGAPRKASEYLNMLQADKKNTPTMGGVFLVPAVLLAMATGSACLHASGVADAPTIWGGFAVASIALVGNAALGLYDDFCKLTRRGKDGIPARVKLVGQTLLALFCAVGAFWVAGDSGQVVALPFADVSLGWAVIPLSVFVIVGAGNAYNLTDGLDGLAGGTGAVALWAMAGGALLLALFGGPQTSWVVVAGSAAAAGGLVGFLYWNRHPAKVFMGDTGSLGIGALIGVLAVLSRLELLLAIAGAVFVVEALSVIIQVGYFKLSGGMRVFRCAPLHHHYQFGGWHETRVTRTFIRAGLVCAALGVVMTATLVRPPKPEIVQARESAERTVPDAVVSR